MAGRIGDTRQTLTLDIAANAKGYTGIRLDPADRPGFLRLYRLLISTPNNGFAWQWVGTGSNFAELGAAHHQQMLLVPPGEWSDSALLVLYGDDPWIELPLNPLALQQISTHGARLEITVGWPMSADYLQASAEINQKISQLQLQNSQLTQITGEMQQKNQSLACIRDENVKLAHQLALLQRTVKSKDLVLEAFREEKLLLLNQLQQIRREQTTSAARIAQLMAHLQGIEQSNVFRITRPLVRMKMRIDHLRGHSKAARPMPITHLLMPQPIAVSPHPVDIIVPVYRGLEDTRCCLESVLAACCNTRWRLVVINDCSPEPDLTQWLRELARRESRIELLENSENLGFVATVNRGMALSVERDVLLLNSDAEVANDWLDRIQRAAYSAPKVASVTPFSNNATICSYPGFCKANQLPAGQSTASLDALFARHLAGQTVQVPTGVGFCMYLRRQSLQEVGLFDVENFGKGYGEENDFCVRAQALGWINLHVLDTFVRHAGGISFGFAKSEREAQAMDTLRRLHPRYEADVMDFVGRDPARPARLTLDIARITATGQPVILNVIHNREGGTLRHIQELAQRLGGLATFLRLTPAPKGVILQLEGPDEAFSLHFTMPQDQHKLVQTLQLLQVGHIHFHHLLGHDPAMADLASQLGISHDFTAHDFFSYCPQISLTDHTDRYCGELGLAQCRQCLQRHPAPGGVGIEQWRERHAPVLSQARYVIAPSLDAARRLERFTPGATIRVVPHSRLEADPVVHPKPCLPALPAQQRLKVAVLGALSRIKGADVLEEVATLAAQRGELVDFHLIGYAYRSLRTQPKARLTVHGSYDDKDLLQLLQWLQPDAIWFPAVWPETYSYTLSAALESGLPIIAPNIGAFAERIQGRDWTWQCDWQQTPDQWIEFFKGIRERHFCCGFGPAVLAPRPGDALPDDQPFSYTESYLDALPRPLAPDAHALAHIQQQLSSNLYWLDTSNPPGSVFKSSTLRTISRLRTSAALSPLARLVPTHLQRRVKSWLGK